MDKQFFIILKKNFKTIRRWQVNVSINVKKKVIYDFRKEDLINKGQGAPLTPIFHNLLSRTLNEKHQIDFPICFLNIGGISNITKIIKKDENIGG